MRFAIIISFAALLSLAFTPHTAAQNIDLASTTTAPSTPRLQKGKRPALLKTAENFTIDPITTGLGDISALAYDGRLHLYASDRESGRVWRLSDRNQDGRFESKQALPHRFDNPSGLAVKGDRLYVADKNAIWLVNGFLPPSILAGLRQSESQGQNHPLILNGSADTLILGLTTQSGQMKMLSIDTQTGVSALIEGIQSDNSIAGLSMAPNDVPWILTKNSLGMKLDRLKEFSGTQNLKGLSLPPTDSTWSGALPNRIILSRQSPDGFDVVAVSTNFGQAGSMAEPLLSGFLSSSGRTAWGAPSALLFDSKGLIFADSFNGDLYRLSYLEERQNIVVADAPTPIVEDTPDSSPETSPPSSLLSTIEGSKINSASSLDSGSNISVGSTIVRDYKPLSTDKEGETTSEKTED